MSGVSWMLLDMTEDFPLQVISADISLPGLDSAFPIYLGHAEWLKFTFEKVQQMNFARDRI